MSDDVAAVLAERYHQWQYGDNGTHDSLTEAALVSREALAALTAAGYAVVKVPEGVAVAHGARVIETMWNSLGPLYRIEDAETRLLRRCSGCGLAVDMRRPGGVTDTKNRAFHDVCLRREATP